MKEKYWMMQMPYDESALRRLKERFKPGRLTWRDIEMEKTNQIQQTLNERGKNYGSFDDVAKMSQQLKAVLLDTNTKLKPHQKEAGEMICLKLARIFAGCNPDYEDNWRDIAGYAVLGGRLEE